MSICYDLRFPELYRILALRGARVLLGAGGVHARDDARPLGDAAARARDREPGLRDRRQPDRRERARPLQRRALDDRRPLGRRARAGAPTPSGVIVADLDLARLEAIRATLPSLANRRAAERLTAWPAVTR